MVRCVIDGGSPDFAQLQSLRHRQEMGEAAAHRIEVCPIDRARRAWRFVGVTHTEEQAPVFEAPVEAAREIEGHRTAIGLERGVWFGHGNLMANRAGWDRHADHRADLAELRTAGQDRALGFDAALFGEDRG